MAAAALLEGMQKIVRGKLSMTTTPGGKTIVYASSPGATLSVRRARQLAAANGKVVSFVAARPPHAIFTDAPDDEDDIDGAGAGTGTGTGQHAPPHGPERHGDGPDGLVPQGGGNHTHYAHGHTRGRAAGGAQGCAMHGAGDYAIRLAAPPNKIRKLNPKAAGSTDVYILEIPRGALTAHAADEWLGRQKSLDIHVGGGELRLLVAQPSLSALSISRLLRAGLRDHGPARRRGVGIAAAGKFRPARRAMHRRRPSVAVGRA